MSWLQERTSAFGCSIERRKKALAARILAAFKWALAEKYELIIEMDADFSATTRATCKRSSSTTAQSGEADLVLRQLAT